MSTEEDGVPEMLLALAKDNRYVGQCDRLLKEMYGKTPFGLAWLLYALLVVRRNHHTLGMDFCGIKLKNGNRLWFLMSLSAATSMLIEYSCREHSGDDADNNEQLRGRARRRHFEEQRRAMMQRATSGTLTSTQLSRPRQRVQSLVTRLVDLLKRTLLDLSSLTLADDGPHTLPSAANVVLSLAKVLVRLQVIRFCLKGKLPLWNTLGIQVESKRKNLLATQPNLHRFVAVLLAQQVLATTVRDTVQFLTKLWIQRKNRQPPAEASVFSPPPSEVGTDLVCGICKLPRTHPAIPKACGHVFCWKCLYQWVAVTRPECPLCRAPCKPQDVMALYYYRP